MEPTTQPQDKRLLTKPDCSLAFKKNRPSELSASYSISNSHPDRIYQAALPTEKNQNLFLGKNMSFRSKLQIYVSIFAKSNIVVLANVSIKISLEKLFFSARECSLFCALKCSDFSRYKSEIRVQPWTFIKMLSSYYSTLKETQYHMHVWSPCAIFMKYEALATGNTVNQTQMGIFQNSMVWPEEHKLDEMQKEIFNRLKIS